MPTHFDHNSVADNGGVAWAKQIGDQLDPGAIQSQIDGYNAVNKSLNQIIDTLTTANSQIKSSWSGDAATAASQTFAGVTEHAQSVVGTVKNTVSTLQTAQTAAKTAKSALAAVPNEVPVPHAGIGASIVSGLLGEKNSGQIAQEHNQAAQTKAADALNSLSESYGAAASDLRSIAGTGDTQETFTTTSSGNGAFNLGSEDFGSTGSSAYAGTSAGSGSGPGNGDGTVHPGHVEPTPTAPGRVEPSPLAHTNPGTGLSSLNPSQPVTGTGPRPAPVPVNGGIPIDGAVPSVPGGTIVGGDTGDEGSGGSGVGAGTGSSTGGFGGGLGSSGVGSGGSPRSGGGIGTGGDSLGSGLFTGRVGSGALGSGDAGSFGGSSAGGGVTTSTGAGASVFGEVGSGPSAGTTGSMMFGGMGGRSGLGVGVGAGEELGSAVYSRGHYFGGGDGLGNGEWISPAIGGDESLLVSGIGPAVGRGRITSAYEGSTDGDGNQLGMMGGGGRRMGDRDEDEERGQRPGYLKEDPEWWKSAAPVAPAVIE
jgi:uncharacterized protein YukE